MYKRQEYFLATQNKIEEKWKQQEENSSTENYTSLNTKTDFATSYFLPVRVNKKQVLALKESKSETKYFVLIDEDKTEHRLFGIGYQEQPWFSFKNNILVWDEIRYDARYKPVSYTHLDVYKRQILSRL